MLRFFADLVFFLALLIADLKKSGLYSSVEFAICASSVLFGWGTVVCLSEGKGFSDDAAESEEGLFFTSAEPLSAVCFSSSSCCLATSARISRKECKSSAINPPESEIGEPE